MKEIWGAPRARCSFSETQFLPDSLSWLASFPPPHPHLHSLPYPSPHQLPSLPCVPPGSPPLPTFHTATSVPVPFPPCSEPCSGSLGCRRRRPSPWQSMLGTVGSSWSLQAALPLLLCTDLLAPRLAVPEHTRLCPACVPWQMLCLGLEFSSSDFKSNGIYLLCGILCIQPGKK